MQATIDGLGFTLYLAAMAATYRRIMRTVFFVLNSIASLVFLLACLAPALNPIQYWYIALLGLGFAFIVVTLIAFIFFWLVFKPRFVLLSLLPLLIGYQSIATFFAFNTTQKFNYQKEGQTLRVAHWNVARFMEWRRNNNKGSQTRLKMMDQIKEQNADVLCMQEFFTSTDTVYYNNLSYMMKDLGYPYFCFAWANDGYLQWFGNAIFSKLPIVDSGKVYYPKAKWPETLLYADIVHNSDTVRVYTTHLQSLEFKKEDFENIEEIKDAQTNVIQSSRGIFGKVRRAMRFRKSQADIIRDILSNDPYPTIFTGDFNDVPNSYAYTTIRGEKFQDVFLKKGFGIGRTFSSISPTLRIDYLLATKDFEVKQFNRIVKNLSDHYMLVADLQLKK
ncbi:MAG TPA: endonuclease/exonuclease/phosphatase family protein [Flavisolibacter sp.]|nr:endonuclease/exonuclease/phosphatase family protein [Flavisolibacter sp.]